MDGLQNHKYLLLTTFRKNGESSGTAMWFAMDGPDRLFMQTDSRSLKARRMRNDPRVLVAPSDRRGKRLGPDSPGRASLHEHHPQAATLLARRYGLMLYVINFLLWISRRQVVYVQIESTP